MYGGETKVTINRKYYRSDTDEFLEEVWGEPMAQINWKYHGEPMA